MFERKFLFDSEVFTVGPAVVPIGSEVVPTDSDVVPIDSELVPTGGIGDLLGARTVPERVR